MQNTINAIDGKILIHIAFHYQKERIGYLIKLLKTFDAYKFPAIDIVIDTNNAEVEKFHPELFNFRKANIICKAHTHLTHPFLLTWQHRENMMQNIQKYDFFMYTEDDILIPWEAIAKWYGDTKIIYPHGYVRTFLRVEKDPRGFLMSIDAEERIDDPVFKKIEGYRYLLPIRPYCAFWIYTKEQMVEFIQSRAWRDVNVDFGIREKAAFGMVWKNPSQHRALIPLTFSNKIDEDAVVYHLGNKYCLMENPHVKIPLDKLIIVGRWNRFTHRVLRYFLMPYKLIAVKLKKIIRMLMLLFE